MSAPLDIKPGDRFTRWVVAGRAGSGARGRLWHVVCDCGNESDVPSGTLAGGYSRSCGCLNRELLHEKNVKHGMAGTSIHRIWRGMRDRCANPNRKEYPNYGGRGIRVCDRWQDFANFYADMGDRPGPKYSLDRIDVNGDYEPSNVQWATRSDQNANKRPTSVCRNGHPRTQDNTLVSPTPNGSTRLRCRDCDNESRRRYEERKAGATRAARSWESLVEAHGPIEVRA